MKLQDMNKIVENLKSNINKIVPLLSKSSEIDNESLQELFFEIYKDMHVIKNHKNKKPTPIRDILNDPVQRINNSFEWEKRIIYLAWFDDEFRKQVLEFSSIFKSPKDIDKKRYDENPTLYYEDINNPDKYIANPSKYFKDTKQLENDQVKLHKLIEEKILKKVYPDYTLDPDLRFRFHENIEYNKNEDAYKDIHISIPLEQTLHPLGY
jgi:hypothetical protein